MRAVHFRALNRSGTAGKYRTWHMLKKFLTLKISNDIKKISTQKSGPRFFRYTSKEQITRIFFENIIIQLTFSSFLKKYFFSEKKLLDLKNKFIWSDFLCYDDIFNKYRCLRFPCFFPIEKISPLSEVTGIWNLWFFQSAEKASFFICAIAN